LAGQLLGNIRLVKEAVGLKAKFAALIFILSRNICRLLLRLRLVRAWEFVFYLLPFDIIVKNEDGIFYCRRGTVDIHYTDPRFESPFRTCFNLKKGVFLDVGAHIGKYAIVVGRKLKQGKIIAIEPEPSNFEILEKNIILNKLSNVIAFNIAASDRNGIVTFYKIKGPHTDWHSIVRPRGDYEKVEVEAKRLSDVLMDLGIKQIDLLKIDVEGAESLVLKGLGSKLVDVKKIIYEVSDEDECEPILKHYGFKITRVFDLGDSKYKLAVRR